MTLLRVGLTGGLASGKSTVARGLAERGFHVLDADRLVADLYRPGAAGARAVRELFGDGYLDADGAVDHAALARRVFPDADARRSLEREIHPLVRRELERRTEGLDGVAVLEATLLVEAGYAPGFDLVVTVEADPSDRLERAVRRGMERAEAEARLAAQGDGAARRAAADRVLTNDGDLGELERATRELAAELERLWREKAERERAATAAALGGAALVTGNPGKLAEARRLCGPQLEGVEADLPEIQSLDLLEVLSAKADEAWRRLGRPLVVEETGLELDALEGFPGPLVKWMLRAIGPGGIARLADRLGDRRATARCALLYRDAERTVVAEGRTRGTLTPEPRGDGGFGWDPVFVPEGSELTYAELGDAVKDSIGHRGRAWRALLERLTSS
ncbi:MAG: dephospho-CoA kinase [Thermoanaerobaculia bacterium]|nr:dephospho-CoA kinase [Thermoanaerobaculia bacterium]